MDLDLASTSSVVMTSTEMGFSHITCWPNISLKSPLELDFEKNTYQTQVEPHTDQRGVRCRRGRDEDCLSAAAPHAVLRVRIVPDGRRQVLRRPLVGPGLRVAGGDELDARLLEGEDPRADGAQAAEADQGELETRLGGHLFEYDGYVYMLQDSGECANPGPAPGGLINSPMFRISRNKYTNTLETEVVEHDSPGVSLLHPGRL